MNEIDTFFFLSQYIYIFTIFDNCVLSLIIVELTQKSKLPDDEYVSNKKSSISEMMTTLS